MATLSVASEKVLTRLRLAALHFQRRVMRVPEVR